MPKYRFIIIVLVIFLPLFSIGQKKIMLLEIKAQIDARTNRYLDLGLKKAKKEEVEGVIIEMDTYGGAVYDANDMRNNILEFEIPVHVYIKTKAISAGALISIACDSIYMARGANIGAATVVTQTGEAAPDKYQSFMRSIMRSTAEAKGRDPKIAEAMVDEKLDLDSISPSGSVLTFTVDEALKNGFCEKKVKSIDEILERNGWQGYEMVQFDPGMSENIISVFLNPFVSGILLMIILGGLYFELQTPGVGFPILAAVVAAILYFVPYYLNGLAENWEILLFIIGVILIGVEVFVIPGFGLAGVLGVLFTISGLTLVMLENDNLDFTFVPDFKILISLGTVLSSVALGMILLFFGGVRLANSRSFQRIALLTTMKREEGFTSPVDSGLVGKKGRAFTILRPAGKVMIDEEIYDALTRGEHIEKNEPIQVISDEGPTLKVKKV
jgi:membrane-bound serine protease (ClpP class)